MRSAMLVVFLTAVASAESVPTGGAGKRAANLTLSATLSQSSLAPGDPILVRVELANAGKDAIDVVSHVEAGERHYDPFTIRLYWPSPSREGCNPPHNGKSERRITLVDAREKSARVTATLKPATSLTHEIDIAAWASREVNGTKPLGPGFYLVRVDYAHAQGKRTTTVKSQVAGFTITGSPTGTMCKKNPGWRWFGPPR